MKKRWENGRGYKDCPKMCNAIRKYGWNNIEHAVLYEGLDKATAETKEIELIAYYNATKNGYNIEHGGNTKGTHSEETKKKISKANKGKKKGPCPEERKRELSEANKGENNPFFGNHHTKETREVHSAFMRGNTYFKGRHHSEEYKEMKSLQMHEKYKDGGSPRCKPVAMVNEKGEEKTFYSLRNAARVTGYSLTSLYNAVAKGKTINGCQWRYINE